MIFKVFLVLALNLMNAKHVMVMHFEFKMETIVYRKANPSPFCSCKDGFYDNGIN